MSEELEQLKDDLAKLLEAAKIYDARYKGADWKATLGIIESRIARLEAEQADPWREAKDILDAAKEYGGFPRSSKGFAVVVKFFDHLTAERDRLAARVAELEAKIVVVALALGIRVRRSDCRCQPRRPNPRPGEGAGHG